MKRNINQISKTTTTSSSNSSNSSSDIITQQIKRINSEQRLEDGKDNTTSISSNNSSYFLIHQNKELERELKRRKEKLNELEEKSTNYDKQIVKIEEFIGFMDRVWNQFESDISLLIQAITSHSQSSESESHNHMNLEDEEQQHQQQFNEDIGDGEDRICQEQQDMEEQELVGNRDEFNEQHEHHEQEIQQHQQEQEQQDYQQYQEEQQGDDDNQTELIQRDEENEQESQSWSSLLQQYLDSNRSFFELVPCSIAKELVVDEWSNDHEIEEAKLQAYETILDSSIGLEEVKEELMNRLEFTKKNVERLYEMIIQQTDGQFALSLIPLVDDRNFRAEIDLLRDQVTSYKHEVIRISAELAYSQRKLKKAEKQILHLTETNTQLNNFPLPQLQHLSSTQSVLSVTSERKDSTPLGNNENQELMNVVDEVVKETPLCQQNGVILDSRMVIQEAVNKLLQQLQETQQKMLNAEKSLTEYMTTIPNSQPVSNSAEIIRLQKLLTEVRTVSNKRLADVRAEKAGLMTKISDMERAMTELVHKTENTIQQMSNACEEQLDKERNEKEKLILSLKSMEGEVKLMSNMQSQVAEMQLIHDNSKSKMDTLTEKIKAQTTTISILENNLLSSKQREEALEVSLQELVNKLHQEETISSSSSSSQQQQHHSKDKSNNNNNMQLKEKSNESKLNHEDDEEGVIHENTTVNQSPKKSYELISQLLSQAQARCKELENELIDAKANMDELIVEIEAVANEEEKMRQQNSRLLKQITDGHNVHKAVLQENLRLHQDITSLNEKEALTITKMENMTNQMKLNDSLLQQLKQSEQTLRSELSTNSSIISESKITIETQQKTIEEHENKIKLQQTNLDTYEIKLRDLKERCNQLNDQSEEERNKRMELERLREQDKIEREKEANKITALMSKITENNINNGNNSSSTTQTDEMKMLEMTLNMLRCSVCKDRFKQVIITKCYHLFCKECINENLKNRNRKCPACGEKFGQDDVKLVYFAH